MTTARQYAYVGSKTVLKAVSASPQRAHIWQSADIRRWINDTKQMLDHDNRVVATFVIDLDGNLWIADQRSEHVACAAGQKVLSAGEMTFQVFEKSINVIEVTNQSTGYCPEPESWPVVDAALTKIAIAHPTGFTTAFLFRKCDSCGTTNIIKDDWFECGVCQAPLRQTWNFPQE